MSEITENIPVVPAPPAGVPVASPQASAPVVSAVATAAPAVVPPVELQFTARPMKIAAVPFLNAQPLIWQLAKHHHLSQLPPVKMGAALRAGQIDVALAPIAAYLLDPALVIIPVAAIGSNGPVKSVRILSNGSLKNVERLFVDARSQTSVLLSRLILKRWYGVKKLEVIHQDMSDFKPNQTKPWEGVLQFGDGALVSAPNGMTVTDLGEEWTFRTGKPFVYAVWMAGDTRIAKEIENDLLIAKNEGVKHFGEIADQYHGIWVFKHPQSKEYLEKNINYTYSDDQVQGRLEFQKLLKEEGLI